MAAFYRLWVIILLLITPTAYAINGIIYQPQLRDMAGNDEDWQQLMSQLRQQKFDTLVVQWTRYGDAFQTPQQQKWLQQRLLLAHQTGLRLVVGLYSDPEFFKRQSQPAAALENYLNRLRYQDVQLAKTWLALLGEQTIAGWYISAEIDDLNWRTEARQSQAIQWLKQTQQQLMQIANKPVYISSFFAGNMLPADYQQLITQLSNTGVHVWLQDGAGVAKLTAAERRLYLDSIAGCGKSAPAAGVVYEIFQQKSADVFQAQPLTNRQLAPIMAQLSRCNKDKLLFSLRYLPQAKGTVLYH